MTAPYSYSDLKLLKQKKYRGETGLFLAEGEKFIEEIPHNFIRAFFISKTYAGKHADFADNTYAPPQRLTPPGLIAGERDTAAGVPVTVLKDSLIDALSANKTPQGRIAVCEKPFFNQDDIIKQCAAGFSVLLYNTADPGNLGSIIRSARAMGAAAVFLSGNAADIYAPKTLQSAAGAVFHVPIIESLDFAEFIPLLKQRGICVTAAVPQGGEPLYDADLSQPCAFLFGGEANGLPEDIAASADKKLYIPMPGGAESLNLAAAAAVFMYEKLRRSRADI